MTEQWTTTEVAQYLGAGSVRSVSRTLGRWGIQPLPGVHGPNRENLYDADEIRAAQANRPGRGARTDLNQGDDDD